MEKESQNLPSLENCFEVSGPRRGVYHLNGLHVKCPGCIKEYQLLEENHTHDRTKIPFITTKLLLRDDVFSIRS